MTFSFPPPRFHFPAAHLLAILAFLPSAASPAAAQISQEWSQMIIDTAADPTASYHGKAADLEVDADGNVYVATGITDSTGIYYQAMLVKYGPDGTQLWMKTHDGLPNGSDFFRSVALDDAQGVYVTGYEIEIDGGAGTQRAPRILTQKFDRASGDLLWSRTYDATARGDNDFLSQEYAIAVETDVQNNVYVAGTSNQQGTSFASDDFILIKYAADGDEQWYTTYDSSGGTGENADHLHGMTVDDAGNVYLIGNISLPFSDENDYATLKYNASGDLLWARTYDNEAVNLADDDTPAALTVDAQGNVIVTGTSAFPDSTNRDYLTIKYSATGDSLWTARYDNGHSLLRNDDWAHDVAVDADGNIYVTGGSQQDDDSFQDYLTIKYSPAGDTLWTRRYNGPANEHDVAYVLALDADQNVYVIGNTGLAGGSADSDYGIMIYSPAGDSLGFVMKEPPTNGSHDYPTDGLIDASGNLYVTGYQQLFSSANLITVKYAPGAPSPVEPVAATLPERFALHASYPNPFNPRAVIPFDVKAPTHVRLAVYDLLGRRVATLVDERRTPGRYEAVFEAGRLPSGVYFYAIEMGDFHTVRTMMLVK